MVKKLVNSMRRHDHWFAEWWSSILLISVGIYGLVASDHFIIQQSFIDGFLRFIPFDLWALLFTAVGFMQGLFLLCENEMGRGIASFLASSLLIWGTMNIAFYGQWHFSLVAWGVFASINLYALSRILKRGIKRCHEPL